MNLLLFKYLKLTQLLSFLINQYNGSRVCFVTFTSHTFLSNFKYFGISEKVIPTLKIQILCDYLW